MAEPILWQFRYSHYNDKARWALDFKRVPHVRRSLLPGPHIPRILLMTGQKAVPVLVTNGETIVDSTRIIEAIERLHPAPPLYPDDAEQRRRALLLEEFFDEELGPHLRRLWFYELLPHTAYSAAQLSMGAAPAVRRVYRALFPALRVAMKLDMRIDARGAELGRAKVQAALDRLEAELQPSGYLAGDGFSVADLTAAAMFSPIVMPPEFPYPFLSPLPASAAKFRDSLSARRGFQWVEDMYRRHRGTSMEVGAQRVG